MKTQINKPMFVLVSLIALALTGCGKTNNNSTTPGTPGYVGPQVNPGGPYPGGTLGSACAPINGPLSFQGGIYIDSANIYAGQGATAPNTGYNQGYAMNQTMQLAGSGSDGWMTMQVQMTSSTSANAYGQLQLSPLVVQQIQYQMASSGLPYGQVPCASISAINVGHYNTTIYGGGFGGGRAVLILINGTLPYYVHF